MLAIRRKLSRSAGQIITFISPVDFDCTGYYELTRSIRCLMSLAVLICGCGLHSRACSFLPNRRKERNEGFALSVFMAVGLCPRMSRATIVPCFIQQVSPQAQLLGQIVENGFIGLGKLASILGDHCALLG